MTTATPSAPSELKDLADYIPGVMERWNVPGLSIAVVKDGEVIYKEGFGYRDRDKKLPVTTRTLFAIGSSTKAFTTMAMGTLVDEGKMDWDGPVRQYFPWFAMHDPFATDRITPRDLVTHRSGLPRHDLLWYNNTTATRREILERIRYLPPNADFRTVWQYQNLMYLTAGYLAGELAGCTWEKLIEDRIFRPLNMNSSNFSVTASQLSEDFARPYVEKDGEVNEVPFRNIDLVGPAGSINSNVEDMTQWVKLHLGKGTVDGSRVVSEGQIAEMHRGHMPMQATYYPLEENGHPAYGLAWFIENYNGDTMIHHGGAIDGFLGLVAFLPKHNMGVVVQTNLSGNPVPFIVSYNVLDRLRGRTPSDTEAQIRKISDEAKAAMEKSREQSRTVRIEGAGPSHPLEDYVGQFENPGYGTITIGRNENGLTYTYNDEMYQLEHYHYDIFEWEAKIFEVRFPVSFSTGLRGDIDRLFVALESTMAPSEFTRAADQSMRQRSFLERFVGDYEIMGRSLMVMLEGEDKLVVDIPGQPKHELEPYRGTEFKIKGLPGYFLEFKEDEKGAVTSVQFTQPGGVFEAKKKEA
jgi:CubicO group peptidase (beta-lactamase class C family)